MNKEKVLKIIPYVILVVGIVLVLSSFVAMQSVENKCNEHWGQQFQDYQKELNPTGPLVPGVDWNISLDVMDNGLGFDYKPPS